MAPALWAGIFFEEDSGLLRAMPVMIGVLCVLAIAYRYYSAFLARKVAQRPSSPCQRWNPGIIRQPEVLRHAE